MSALGDIDLYLAGEGRHERLYERLGAHSLDDGGVRFAVWAPNARTVSAVGDWNYWSEGADALEPRGSSGIWEGIAANAREGHRYKLAVVRRRRHHASEGRPVRDLCRGAARERLRRLQEPLHVVGRRPGWNGAAPASRWHSPSPPTRFMPDRGGRGFPGSELAEQLVPYVADLGLHARRADAGHAAPVPAVVGIPGERVLRAAVDPRHARRLPRARRRLPRRGRRRDPRLGARALPSRRVGARPLRRHEPLRARGSTPRLPSRLGHSHLQLLASRGAQLPARERPLLGARVPRRRAPRGRRRLDALPRLLARPGPMAAERAGRPREPRAPSRSCAS